MVMDQKVSYRLVVLDPWDNINHNIGIDFYLPHILPLGSKIGLSEEQITELEGAILESRILPAFIDNIIPHVESDTNIDLKSITDSRIFKNYVGTIDEDKPFYLDFVHGWLWIAEYEYESHSNTIFICVTNDYQKYLQTEKECDSSSK